MLKYSIKAEEVIWQQKHGQHKTFVVYGRGTGLILINLNLSLDFITFTLDTFFFFQIPLTLNFLICKTGRLIPWTFHKYYFLNKQCFNAYSLPGTLLITFQIVIYLIFMADIWSKHFSAQFNSVQSLSCVRLFA